MDTLKTIGGYISGYIKSLDKWLLLLCAGLSSASIFFLYGLYHIGITDAGKYQTQTTAVIIGLIVAIIISLFDYRILSKLWVVYMPLAILGVILTFFVGVKRGSNQAWLAINLLGATFSVQPSEFLKISFITTMGIHLNYVKDDLNKIKNVVFLALHGALHVGLIVLQRDDGTAIVFLGIFVVMMFVAGISWKYILPGIAAVIAMVPLVWSKFMSLDQQMRFLVLKDPSLSDKYAYQQLQGLKALGLGGATGTGFSGEYVYVPESYNDFIFTFIGQTTGIIGCLAIIAALAVLCFKLIYNSRKASDTLGQMICIGVMGLILVQSIMNIGMCLNLLPVIGVPLPFLSSGGSSVVSLYAGIGLVLSVYRHKKVGLFD